VWAPSGARLTLAFDCQVGRRGVSRVSEDDVLFGYRLRVFEYAARTSVSEACRVFEPLRESCRLQSLRGWSDDRDVEEVLTGGS
jgi:hypothetical protein